MAWLDAWIFIGVSLDLTIAWVCFKVPFAKQIYMDEMSEEELSHPVVQYLINKTTQTMIIGFGLGGVFALVRGVLVETGNNTNTLNIVLQVLQWSSIVTAVNIAWWVLPQYSESDKCTNMIREKYGDEVEAWNAKNPDHEWAKEWENEK